MPENPQPLTPDQMQAQALVDANAAAVAVERMLRNLGELTERLRQQEFELLQLDHELQATDKELREAKDLLRRIFDAESIPVDKGYPHIALQAELEALFAEWEEVNIERRPKEFADDDD